MIRIPFLDLRRNPGKILEAIERNETVALSKRGHEIAYIVPKRKRKGALNLSDSPAFGMWKDRDDMEEPVEYVRRVRQGRRHDL